MASLPIEERVLYYFLAMGAQAVEPPQNARSGLTLVLGEEKVHVLILNNDVFLRGGRIIESIMSLTSLRDSADLLYLAAPRLLGTTVEAEIFRSQGIGLLLYDDRRIDEAVPPQTFRLRQSESTTPNRDETLLTELAALKSMYLEMQRDVCKLREELKGYQERINCISPVPERIPSSSLLLQEPNYAGPTAELPSFFSNNPWLEVLSKRGREETSPIAG
jgi:hypothetical protein